MVQDIERIHTDLYTKSLNNLEVLGQARVELLNSGQAYPRVDHVCVFPEARHDLKVRTVAGNVGLIERERLKHPETRIGGTAYILLGTWRR